MGGGIGTIFALSIGRPLLSNGKMNLTPKHTKTMYTTIAQTRSHMIAETTPKMMIIALSTEPTAAFVEKTAIGATIDRPMMLAMRVQS